MSEVALEGLLIRLKSTLSLHNRQWLAEHLVENSSEEVLLYDVAELQERAERGVQQIEAGAYYTSEQCAARREQLINRYSI